MFGIFDYIKIGAGIAIGATLAFYPAKLIGISEGKQIAATASLVKSVEVLRERNTIDDEVSASDAAALCGSFGLSDHDETECMRRIFQTNADAGNDVDDSSQRPAVCEPGRGPQ